jgi:uroporphyrinogen decarboxylase
MPTGWGAGAKASWNGDFGYEKFFLLFGLRPDLAAKLFQLGGAYGYCLSMMVAKAVKEGLFPKALLMGEDICTQRGPMVSVDFMREHYAPALAHGLEPLLEVGCRPVWHSDGDVRALIPMLLECGIKGFQGFQPECGMHIEELVKLRTKKGEKLLIFGPFAVTTELPVLTPGELRAMVRNVAELCKDEADLVFFTSNTINPDVPYENLVAVYDEIKKYRY